MFVFGIAIFAVGYAIAYHGANVLWWAHGPGDSTKHDPVPFHNLLGFRMGTAAPPPGFIPLINLEGVKPPAGANALGGGPAAGSPQVQGSSGPPSTGGDPGQVLNT